MSQTPEQIAATIKLARENGCESVSIDGVLYKISPLSYNGDAKVNSPVPEVNADDIVKPISILDEATDEEIRFWSTPYYDVLMAEKKSRQEKLNEEIKERSNG